MPIPEQLTVDSVTATTIHLTWIKPNVMEQTPHSYQISYYSGGLEPQTFSTVSCSAEVTDLQPDTKYKVSICTKFNDRESVTITKEVQTGEAYCDFRHTVSHKNSGFSLNIQYVQYVFTYLLHEKKLSYTLVWR